MTTLAEVRQALLAAFPEGFRDYIDTDEPGNVGKFITGAAQAWKAAGFDQVDRMYLEISPLACIEKVPDWEGACGLSETPIAQFGTIDQRRAAYLAKLRESGTSSIPDIQTAVQPFLMYQDQSQIQVLEADRIALQTAHTYTMGALVLGASSTGLQNFTPVLDDPRVGAAGAIVTLQLTANLDEFRFSIEGPDGTTATFGPNYLGDGSIVGGDFTVRSKLFVGKRIKGTWSLRIQTGPSAGATLHNATLFVEGLGRNPDGSEGLEANIHEFVVFADPALLGTGYDIEGANRTVQRIKPAHTRGAVTLGSAAGDACAIPDTVSAIPDRAIPCS